MKLGLLAPIDAEAEHAEAMLRNAAELAKQEQNTVTWLSFRENATTVGVFHTFADEQARRAHLEGRATDAIDRILATHDVNTLNLELAFRACGSRPGAGQPAWNCGGVHWRSTPSPPMRVSSRTSSTDRP
jgi:superfamily I DNA/RNA helicase